MIQLFKDLETTCTYFILLKQYLGNFFNAFADKYSINEYVQFTSFSTINSNLVKHSEFVKKAMSLLIFHVKFYLQLKILTLLEKSLVITILIDINFEIC